MADNNSMVPIPGENGIGPRTGKGDLPAEPIAGYGPAQYLEEESIDLRKYLDVLLRHKWVIIAICLAVLITTGLRVFTTRPVYKAQATVEINLQPSLVPFNNSQRYVGWYEQRRYMETQADILQSRALARRVIEVLDLENNPEFKDEEGGFSLLGTVLGLVGRVFALFQGKSENSGRQMSPEELANLKDQALVSDFLGRLTVKPPVKSRNGDEGSSILEVSFQGHNPALCAKIVNTLVDEYIKFDLEKRIQATKLGHRYLKKQIASVQAKLEDAEERLNEFSKKHDIIFLNQINGMGEGQNIETVQLGTLNEELSKARSERIALETYYNQSVKNPNNLPQVLNDPLIQSLKEELSKLEQKYANLSSVFKPGYPKMKRIKSELRSIKRQIARQKQLIIATIKTKYQTALKKEKMLAKALKVQKTKVTKLKQLSIDYKILKREVDTYQRIYELLLNKAKEMDVEVGIKSSGIHPIDRAEIPLAPFMPRPMRSMFLALIVGLFLGVAASFVLEYFDNTFKSPEEVEDYLRLPILGTIPNIITKSNGKEHAIELESLREPRSSVSEAVRMIRTSLMLSVAENPPEVLLVTSPQTGAGKTFLSFNLAVVYAQMDARVLLLDCDLRKPRLHKIVGVASNPGLSNFLVGKIDLRTITKSIGPNLGDGLGIDFIASGAIPPNPVELLNSRLFSSFLENCRDSYDIIIMDSPPLLGFADSLVLGRLADGTLTVIRNEKTERPAAKHGCDLLFKVGANLLGVVVNDVKVRKGSYYYGKYYSYYHYHYGNYASKEERLELTK